ncbi:ferritin-like domain-containing protein [Erythrobacter litoralis]|uniref:ferritin-like domain-containing protein n=1 Tax=Erythrobacter litoralis TaxID=39960 RepID=UPI0024360FDA|nr:ferritin-like domain-containing protein [Erythrobacter litoralis]MDG6079331.1 ferritin-like domain-containing protein [Erythrobacter litoralis]
MSTRSLSCAIREALLTGEAKEKVFAARTIARDWRMERLEWQFECAMPDRPAWPRDLHLAAPGKMPKRGKGGSEKGRIALWHALAHIEFVAIDLALDMAGRFGEQRGPQFMSDFLSVAADEAMHFALLDRKLRSLGSCYGALPVHDGLWESAARTAHDVKARLAIVPMVLEARGLDVTPATLERIKRQGDENGARILQRILDDEIRHVAIGTRHFHETCRDDDENPQKLWRNLVRRYFSGGLKPPFNDSARSMAGLSRAFYAGLA